MQHCFVADFDASCVWQNNNVWIALTKWSLLGCQSVTVGDWTWNSPAKRPNRKRFKNSTNSRQQPLPIPYPIPWFMIVVRVLKHGKGNFVNPKLCKILFQLRIEKATVSPQNNFESCEIELSRILGIFYSTLCKSKILFAHRRKCVSDQTRFL